MGRLRGDVFELGYWVRDGWESRHLITGKGAGVWVCGHVAGCDGSRSWDSLVSVELRVLLCVLLDA